MKRTIAIVALVFVTAACAGPTKAVRVGPEVPEATKVRVLSALRERNGELRSLKGLASVRYGAGIFGGRGEAAFVVDAPDRARIDTLTDFGVAQSQLALNRGRLTVLWPAAFRYFEGDADAETLGRYAGIGLSPETLIGILLGKIPLGGKTDADTPRVYESGPGAYVVKADGLEAKVIESAGALVPESYTALSAEGRPVYRVAFDGYASEDGRPPFPERLAARLWKEGESRTKAKIDVEYRDLEINPKIESKTFELKIPDEAEPVSE